MLCLTIDCIRVHFDLNIEGYSGNCKHNVDQNPLQWLGIKVYHKLLIRNSYWWDTLVFIIIDIVPIFLYRSTELWLLTKKSACSVEHAINFKSNDVSGARAMKNIKRDEHCCDFVQIGIFAGILLWTKI